MFLGVHGATPIKDFPLAVSPRATANPQRGMSGFAIRMSAYKTVNKRADPKRNFAASLARSGYTAKEREGREERGKGGRSIAFREEWVKRTSRARKGGCEGAREGGGEKVGTEGWNESGNRGNERNRREKIRAHELVGRRGPRRERTTEEKGGNRRRERKKRGRGRRG